MKGKISRSLIAIAVLAIWGTVLMLKGEPRERYMNFYYIALAGAVFALLGYAIIYFINRRK